MNDSSQQFDCVISGAGMVGAACALALAQLGLTVALIDKQAPAPFDEQQPFDLRVSAISLASEQLLQQLAVWPAILAMRTCVYRRLGVWEMDAAAVEFNAADIGQTHLGHIIENRIIQLALWQQIEQQANIQLFCPEQVQSFVQQPQTVQLSLVSGITLITPLLIAADGALSAIRQQAKIGVTGWNYQQSAMIINVATQLPQQDITWQKFLPTGPVAMLPLVGQQASLVWYHQQADIARLAQLSKQQLQLQIQRYFPQQLGEVKVLKQASFSLTRQHANAYYQGQVVVIGDAAHTINPLAGQGVNLGFKDVLALQTSIAEAISAGKQYYQPSVLQQYQHNRRLDNSLMMSGMDLFYQGFSHPSTLVKAARNVALTLVDKIPMAKRKLLRYACGID